MKILVVSSYLPYPLLSGGQVRLYNLLKELSSRHEITLICEKRPNQTEQHKKEIEKFCNKVIALPRKKQWSLQNILKSGFSRNSFLVTGHTQPKLTLAITNELKSSKYDLIHCETYYVMKNIPQVDLPIVLAEHNIEYSVYKKFADRLPQYLRPLLALDIIKIKKEEEACWRRASQVVAVSKEDMAVMQDIGIEPVLVANGVNEKEFAYKELAKEENPKKILFIGDFSWIQNSDSVTYIIKEIWPKVKELLTKHTIPESSYKLWIVGRKIPQAIKDLSHDETILYDEESSQKQTPEIFQAANMLLAPIRVGGGTSYKILESMSCGTPVVTMQMSANAIKAVDGKTIMVGNNASEIAEKVCTLYTDEKKYEIIASGGRKLIEEHYTWKMIANVLDNVYQKVVK